MNDHLHWVDHAVVNPHTGTTEYRCRCHKVLVTHTADDITAEPAFAIYAARLQRIIAVSRDSVERSEPWPEDQIREATKNAMKDKDKS